jgi:hypothetical protein
MYVDNLSLYIMVFFDVRLPITPLECSNFSNMSYLCYLYLFAHSIYIVKHVLAISVTWRVFYKTQNHFTPCKHEFIPVFFIVGSVLLIFLFFCAVSLCFVCLCTVLYVPNVASFSGLTIVDCPFGFL